MFVGNRAPLALVAPAVIFVIGAFLIPVFVLLSRSVASPSGFTVSPYIDFFSMPLYQVVFWRTLKLGLFVTALCAAFGYVMALVIVDTGGRARGHLVALLVLPLMISPVARTYSWIVILSSSGLLNNVLIGLGLIDEPIRVLFTETAVFIGLVQLFLPLMVLPLVSSLENMPADVVPAARMLGAGWFTVFFKVILPLTREGLVTGGTLVFTGAITAYITPAVLGGSRMLMLETLLYQRVNIAGDIVTAAVISAILMVASLATSKLLRRIARGRVGR
jgi:putative spermidine/putrescine transport system permease protein